MISLSTKSGVSKVSKQMPYDYDYVVIGSGFGGSVAALRLAEKGYSPLFGVREISRLIQDKIKSFFVDEVLFGSLAHGGRARAEVEGDEVVIKVGD